MPKYVVSSRDETRWSDATVLVGAVAGLKREILVYASYQLGQALIEHDLVDELRLMIFPVVHGAGRRLVGATGVRALRLVDVRTVGSGLAYVTCRRG